MNELKSGDYYEKHYEKVHETQLDGEALSHEIGGKLLSTEIRKAISDVSEYLWIAYTHSTHKGLPLPLFKNRL